jgi:hypothetical protein
VEYFVLGTDGTEYGPATIDTLKQWAVEGRVSPQTQLKSFATGQVVNAASVQGIFPPVGSPAASTVWANPPSPYQRPMGQSTQSNSDEGKGDVTAAIFRSVLALVFFFLFHGIGLIVAAYSVYYAFQAQAKGHRHGITAIAISVVTLIIIIIGWLLRLSGTMR